MLKTKNDSGDCFLMQSSDKKGGRFILPEPRKKQRFAVIKENNQLDLIRTPLERRLSWSEGLSARYVEALSLRKRTELNLNLLELENKYFRSSLEYQLANTLVDCKRTLDVLKLPVKFFLIVRRYRLKSDKRTKLAEKIRCVNAELTALDVQNLPSGLDDGWAPDRPLPRGAVVELCNIAREREKKRGKKRALFKTVLRTGSFQGRGLLGCLASRGLHNYQQIIFAIESCQSPAKKEEAWKVLNSLALPWATDLARVMAGQCFDRDDELNALRLLSIMLDVYGIENISNDAVAAAGALAVLLRNREYLAAFLPLLPKDSLSGAFLRIDYQHPAWGGDVKTWLKQINGFLQSYGLEPVSVSGGERVLFSQLQCYAREVVSNGPLVTVIITAWRPGEELLHAVSSILNQSWRNIEVIIVDDASPLKYLAVLDACRALDERVSVIQRPCNQGTYMARNAGLREARGKYVTFQDSDDWSHPRRVELQVSVLESSEQLVSCYSNCLRVSEDLYFSKPDRQVYRKNTSSMMFRRGAVLKAIGYMDSVRKGADTEYGARMDLVFGPESFKVVDVPLAFVRLGEESLSRQDFKFGWQHPGRNAYKNAYSYWHSLISLGEKRPYLQGTAGERKFPAPLGFRVDRQSPRESTYDVAFIGDWRMYGGPQRSMIEEIKALHQRGMRIAVCQLEAYRFMVPETQSLCDAINEMIHNGVVENVVPSDDIDVRLAILRYPPILQCIPYDSFAWRIKAAWIVANQAPHERDGQDIRYHVGDCVKNAKQLFGLDPVWIPQGFHVRQMLSERLPQGFLALYDNPGIININEWQVPAKRRVWCSNVPVVGRYSRDNPMKFPETAQKMLTAYMADMDIDVMIMGGERTVPALLSNIHVPKNWRISRYGEHSVKEFLSRIDFFIYFDNKNSLEAFGRAILEALASGVVVVASPIFREVFGEAAVYCEAEEVCAIVCRYYGCRELYDAQVKKARNVIANQFSYGAFYRRVADEIYGGD